MKIKNKKGQSTVEYILLVTAVVAVMIVFATGTQNSGLQAQLCSTLNTVTGDIGTSMTALSGSHNPSSAGGNNENMYTVNVSPS